MTSTSKSEHFRGVAASTGGNLIKAAKIFGTGSAGVGLQLATRGYALARREADRRKTHRALATSAPRATNTTRGSLLSTKTRKFVVFGSLFGAAAGIAILVSKRRNTFVEPADAPPSLEDYEETPTPVNGSSAHAARK
ncbi:hypothetical protein [Rhodococcus sovatensis]|uniref:Transmembrane protein n=1 Tax=Rhodococcus sovatensis TaxID=1805840 RepID=A0ABZ2PFM7_9NOCA